MEIQNTTPSPSLLTTHSGHRACASCARAKAKCVPGESGKCQRCQRLLKVCEPVQSQPRSLPRKRKNESASRVHKSHVEKLEEKLDGLVTLLKSSQDSKASNESSVPAIFDTSPTTSRPYSGFNPLSQPSHDGVPGPPWMRLEIANGNGNSQPSQHSDDPVTSSTTATSDFDSGLKMPDCVEFTPDQANVLLNKFRDQKAPFFPFVVVPSSLSAQDLQRDRPFLLKSILAVTSPIPEHPLVLGKWLIRQLTERMAINGERNLDLLLGVLTYTGWFVKQSIFEDSLDRCFYNCYDIPQLTLLLSLGMALMFDLGLNRPPPGDPSSRSLFETALRETTNPGISIFGLHTKTTRSLEDRRVLLGMFFITSVVSKIPRSKTDPLKITPYIYECLNFLDRAHDHENDTCATSLVRLQLIMERIGQGPWNNEFGAPEGRISAPPLMLYVKSLQEQLKSFRSAMPPEVKLKGYVLLHYYHVEETLYEIGLSRSPLTGNFSPHEFHRLELLHACLQSNKMFFETFFAIPEPKYLCFSLATWTQITHSLIVLQMLSNFEHPDWNRVYVRETIDFMEIMDKLIEMFQKMDGWIWDHATVKLTRIKAHIQEKWAVEAAGPRTASLSGEDADMGRTWEPVDFLDEFWATDVFASIASQLNDS